MLNTDHIVPDVLAPAVAYLFDLMASVDIVECESVLMGHLMNMGRAAMHARLESLSPSESFRDAQGAEWKVAVVSGCEVITLFGPIVVARPLFRSERNGPTRCMILEKAALLDDLWTPQAAKVATLAVVEMPAAHAESLLRETGVVNASRSSLNRLAGSLSDTWEGEREAHEQSVREGTEIPPNAATVAVSLDGVMVMKVGSERAKVKAAARERGAADKGPAGWEEASVGVVSFYDKEGERLATRRYARMPEADKATTKRWLAVELTSIRALRPDLTTLAIADGAANNWSFLEGVHADHEVVDFFHTAEHLHRHVSKANGAATVETQAILHKMRHQLLEVPGSAGKIFEDMNRLREKAGTATSKELKKKGRYQPTFFELHGKRMDYARLRDLKLPIGSGVTESTCKLAVCDRLRRTGMRWSQQGGQAILTLRALRISGQFDAGWAALMRTSRERLAA
jgi:hypothetical protein